MIYKTINEKGNRRLVEKYRFTEYISHLPIRWNKFTERGKIIIQVMETNIYFTLIYVGSPQFYVVDYPWIYCIICGPIPTVTGKHSVRINYTLILYSFPFIINYAFLYPFVAI